MRLIDFLYDRKFYFIALIIEILLMYIILTFVFSSAYLRILSVITMVIMTMLPMIHDFLMRREFYRTTEKELSIDMLSELPYSDFYEGNFLRDTLSEMRMKYQDDASHLREEITDYRDYLSMWVHEIKTPVASSRLLIHNLKNRPEPVTVADLNLIVKDLRRIEDEIDKVLYYSKMDELEKDYKITEESLDDMVNSVLSRYKTELISSGFRIIKNNLDQYVLTDPKWIEFILGQLVSNSVKYRKDRTENTDYTPVLIFSVQNNRTSISLSVSDNGMGIDEEDREYIFTKGYTSRRTSKVKSTGYGLYIVKSLIDKLSLDIALKACDSLKSGNEEFTGLTTFTITFPVSTHNRLE